MDSDDTFQFSQTVRYQMSQTVAILPMYHTYSKAPNYQKLSDGLASQLKEQHIQ